MNYEAFRQWFNDARIKLGTAILPRYKRCGCRVGGGYSLTCPIHNPKGPTDAEWWLKSNPEYARGIHDGRRIEKYS